jgi:hypothetical protein
MFVKPDVLHGALTPLYAGTAAEGEKLNGKVTPSSPTELILGTVVYSIPCARIGKPRAVAVGLWDWLEE